MLFQSIRQEYIPASPVLRLHSSRTYGEPKIKRPSELKGLKAEATFAVRGKHAKGGLFLKDGKAWWLCRDFASKDATFPEAKDMELPTCALAKKYGWLKGSFKTFIYPDAWCRILLRNEAWIEFDSEAIQQMSVWRISREVSDFISKNTDLPECSEDFANLERVLTDICHWIWKRGNDRIKK